MHRLSVMLLQWTSVLQLALRQAVAHMYQPKSCFNYNPHDSKQNSVVWLPLAVGYWTQLSLHAANVDCLPDQYFSLNFLTCFFFLLLVHRDSIEPLFESQNFSFTTHSVFLDSSNTPLPLAFDTFPLGGNVLHVRGTTNILFLSILTLLNQT